MSEQFGVDFIARCIAGEALEKAGHATIDVDDALSTTSENPVQNKVITNALKTKPTSVAPDGTVLNDQKIMALTREQYDAIQNKDPNTYYMITDDPVQNAVNVRTAYVDMINNYTKTKVDDNKYNVVFNAPDDFELIEARISYSITFTCGSWVDATLTFSDTLSIPSSVGSTPREGRKIYTQKLADHYSSDATPVHYNQMVDEITGANFIYYDEQTGKITLEIGNLTAPYVEYISGYPENTEVVISDLTITSLGYIAYGPNNVVISDAFVAGDGITIDGTTIKLSDAPAADIDASISNGNLTIQLEDADGVPMGTGATVNLPSGLPTSTSSDEGKVLTVNASGNPEWDEISTSDRTYYCECSTAAGTAAKVVSTTQDFELEKGVIIAVKFANQNTASNVSLNVNNSGAKSIAVGATVPYTGDKPDRCGYGSGYLNYYIYTGTYWHAMGCSRSVNEVPATNASQNGRVLTNVNGSPSWENLPSTNEVPTVGSTDDGKVLTASYTGGVGSYSWQNASSGGLQVETDGTNYWITVNGIRLYFASSEPSAPAGGSIPDGSIGIGW